MLSSFRRPSSSSGPRAMHNTSPKADRRSVWDDASRRRLAQTRATHSSIWSSRHFQVYCRPRACGTRPRACERRLRRGASSLFSAWQPLRGRTQACKDCDTQNASTAARTRSPARMARRMVLQKVPSAAAPARQDAMHLGPARHRTRGRLATGKQPDARVRGLLSLEPAG